MNRRIAIPLVLLAAGLTGLPGAGAASSPAGVVVDAADGQAVPGSYIVTVRDGSAPVSVAGALSVSPTYVYTSALNGFAARLDAAQLEAVRRHPAVVAIEQDQVVSRTGSQNTVFSGWDLWNLDRVDQRALPLSNTFTWLSTGAGITAYVFDSGTRASHVDFGGRVSNIYDAFGGNGDDCDGHGTHVAGTIGGNTVGIAKAVTLKGIRVLDCTGNGTVAGIISAVDWVRANHVKPAVANMSLGSGYSSAFNTSVTNLINAGVFTSVAAGNSNQSACNYSPSSATGAFVVAASDRTDTKASFSNHGSCVDVYAPGVAIWSTWYTSDTTVARLDGTSQASPLAAGLGALYKATFGDASASVIETWIETTATANVINRNRTGTPNLLLFTNGL